MSFIEVMKERGMLAQVTHEEELAEHLSSGVRTAYTGFDPTGDSLHIGHLLPVLALRRWQKAGHRVVVLLGGGTAMIGDPTGKSEMRQMITEEIIASRVDAFRKQLSNLLDLEDPKKGVILNNGDWLKNIDYIPFLREIGSQFSVNRMLTAECFKSRLEKGLSFLEFNYMLLQSYDFLHLNKEEDCSVQLGGDDQWSNMLGGMDLIRRKERKQAFCLTVPLLVSSSGKKMGKTENGAIWLDPSMTSPYDLFQYFRNMEDDMVATCLFYFSDLPVEEVNKLGALEGKDINQAKIVLAYEATKLIHGETAAEESKAMAQKLFEQSQGGANVDAPEVLLPAAEVSEDIGILDLLTMCKVFPSKGEARRMVQQGGISIDGEKLTDPKATVSKETLAKDEGILLKKGKKHYYNVKLS